MLKGLQRRRNTACFQFLLLLVICKAVTGLQRQARLGGGSSIYAQEAAKSTIENHDNNDNPHFFPPLFYGTSWDRTDTASLRTYNIKFPALFLFNLQRGEPLNVIISGKSHPSVLSDSGLLRFSKKLGFEAECLNLHIGDPQSANLRDGNGWLEQLLEIRQAYFPVFGTCFQSAVGGNHFRAWKQNGTLADSGAWFLAVSTEHDYRKNHMITDNGYDRGRDLMVDAARQRHAGYIISVDYLDLIQPGRRFNHGIATDGRVALINVQLY